MKKNEEELEPIELKEYIGYDTYAENTSLKETSKKQEVQEDESEK